MCACVGLNMPQTVVDAHFLLPFCFCFVFLSSAVFVVVVVAATKKKEKERETTTETGNRVMRSSPSKRDSAGQKGTTRRECKSCARRM